MQTKLIEILSEAKDWMTAAEIATKGGWRSPANVGVALQQMEKASGNVERRKSATKKQGNGMPATEWKLTEKVFSEESCVQQSVKSETQAGLTIADESQKGVVRKSSTTEKAPEVFHSASLRQRDGQAFKIEPNMRIAQLVIAPVVRAELVQAGELSDTGRGDGGFGITGS